MADSGKIWAAIPPDGGCVFAAPLGTALPTDATVALNGAFVDLGWVSEDGVVNSINRETQKFYGWGGEVVKVTQSKYEETVKLTLLESTPVVLKEVYGQNAVTTTGTGLTLKTTVEHSPLMLARRSFVIQFIDQQGTGRIVVREGQVTEVADVEYKHDGLTMYELTIDCFRPTDGGKAAAVVAYYDKSPDGS